MSTGHVDAGKSTLMGRVLHELGETSDKEILNYQRQSDKIGKGSFAYAWTFDAMDEERERYVKPLPLLAREAVDSANSAPRDITGVSRSTSQSTRSRRRIAASPSSTPPATATLSRT